MAKHGFFQYLYLKMVVVSLRIIIALTNTALRRDRALVSPAVQQQKHVKIPSRDKGRHILADIYYPPTTSPAPSPVLLNWHGSGFVFPLLGSDTLFCSRIAQNAGIVVIDADYRKSPETPFPGAINDAEDALGWITSQAQLDSNRVAVSGFSAGGNIALVAATMLQKKLAGLINISAVCSIYPVVNLAIPVEDKKVPNPINPPPLWIFRLFNDCYALDPDSRTDPAISPFFADPADFPRTVALITCEGDTLRPEVQELAEKLVRNNEDEKTVINHVLKDVPHGFDKGVVDGSIEHVRREEAYSLVENVLKDTFGIAS
ncbi:Alpha/Beta hydrolase protein [Xylaria curta]|nr:Alpha/Beta hydrolase protein [Xylaria curta]